ncbi:MAG: MobA/MobL family protein, partial [Clostridiales bacterium]|nr:MobA/MobL family protein [Clostridiales bacterium]
MAIYVCNFKIITRGEGRKAVAAASYRSGKKIKNIWDCVEHDYTRKGGVVYKNIILPDNAPAEYKDRSTLWNEVELAEKASDSRLCRECLLALPLELSLQQQTELVERYVKKNFVSFGMCADITIHDPVLTDDLHRPIDKDGNPTRDPAEFQRNNPHAHILLTVRPIGKNGRWEAKTKKEYLCKRDGEQAGFTAEEFKTQQWKGREKQYHYVTKEGKKQWMTPTEAADAGLAIQDRVSRAPRSTPHGRENPVSAFWNDKDRIVEWRRSWADMCNAKFQELGINAFVDHRSYADQGIDKLPQEHMGSYANEVEKRARRLEREGVSADKIPHTETVFRNRWINEYNKASDAHHRADHAASQKIHSTAQQLEGLRSQLIYSSYAGAALGSVLAAATDAARQKETDIQHCIQVVNAMVALNEKSMEFIASLAETLSEIGSHHPKKSRQLKNQIEEERGKIHTREAYAKDILNKYGFDDADSLHTTAQALEEELHNIDNSREQARVMEQLSAGDPKEYEQVKNTVPACYRDRMISERLAERARHELAASNQLKDVLKERYSEKEYKKYIRLSEKRLTENIR